MQPHTQAGFHADSNNVVKSIQKKFKSFLFRSPDLVLLLRPGTLSKTVTAISYMPPYSGAKHSNGANYLCLSTREGHS